MMENALLEEVEIKDEPIEIKEEGDNADQFEILDPFGPSFLCTICGKNHSKNLPCVDDSNIIKTEVFLCLNHECGQFFLSETELEQHADSCQATDPLSIEPATEEDEDGPNMERCKECQEKFKTNALFLQHMRSVHSELIKCYLFGCNTFFKKQTDFEEHRTKAHRDSVFCDICGKVYKCKFSLQLHFYHQHLHRKGTLFERSVAGKTRCPHCCNFYKQLKPHLKLYHPETMVKCLHSICDRTFFTQEEMQVHAQKIHKPKKCNICHTTFSSNGALQLHILKQHKPKKIVRKSGTSACMYCGQFVKRLIDHVKKIHPDKLIQCKQKGCRKLFATANSFQDHWQQFHSQINCTECNAVFKNNSLYINHIYEHHQGNKYVKCNFRGCIHFFQSYPEMEQHYQENHSLEARCDLCGYLAPSRSSILKHMKIKHSSIFENQKKKEGKTKCSYCRKFVKHINNHLKRAHPEKIIKQPQASCSKNSVVLQNRTAIKCAFCTQVFIQNNLYIQHVNSCHQGRKLFRCSFTGCIHFFQSQPEMEKHYKESHLVQPKCDMCGHLAPTWKAVMQHIKQIHNPTVKQPNVVQEVASKSQHCALCLKDIPLAQMKTHKNAICVRCKKVFPCRGLMDIHSLACDLQCLVCNKIFKDRFFLKRHELTHNQGPSWSFNLNKHQAFKCEECNLNFPSMNDFREHLMLVHWKMVKLRCDLCEKKFASNPGICPHVTQVDNDEDKIKIIDNQLETHEIDLFEQVNVPEIKYETEAEIFKCHKCPMTFYERDLMKEHVKIVHG